MEEFMQTTNLDSRLIDEIVCKVKSEGLFDQFRRECLADVDTKPAYQNLQNRVESSVSSFLEGQEWNSHLNKNQLREKLRKLITDKKFFEAGIERIVDQVVNPKLNSNFVPKIEDVAYKFLGIDNMKLKLEIDGDVLLPVFDLEQVSPDSEKSHSNETKVAAPVFNANSACYQAIYEESDEKNDDLESPAFEPIETSSDNKIKSELRNDDDMDISDGDDASLQMNEFGVSQIDEVKSNLSSISGLTSNDSNNSASATFCATARMDFIDDTEKVDSPKLMITEKIGQVPANYVTSEILCSSSSVKLISNTSEFVIENINQDSVLSQVSSTSRLSIVTNNNTSTQMNEGDSIVDESREYSTQNSLKNICPYGISEEAQMQQFNENSSSNEGSDITFVKKRYRNNKELTTNFDINQEKIKFEGTEYNTMNTFNKDIRNYIANQKVDCEENIKYTLNLLDDVKTNDVKGIMNVSSPVPKTENTQVGDHSSLIQSDNYFHNFRNESSDEKPQRLNEKEKNRLKSNLNKYTKEDAESRRCSKRYKEKKSSTKDKSNLKVDKYPNKEKHRTDHQRSTKTDDHFTHKDKVTSRQRSHSKDSNDSNNGFTRLNPQNSSLSVSNCNNVVNQSTPDDQTTDKSPNEKGNIVSHTQSENMGGREQIVNVNSIECYHFEEREKSVLPSQPVVIDQILTGNELDLKTFIGENRDDPVVSSIEQSLAKNVVKKPKLAANIFEAKRLMRIRKQIELSNQKKIEQATVMAKQYIRTNASTIRDGTQGIELEFVCRESNGKNIFGPIISSPVTYVENKNINELEQIIPAATNTPTSITLKKTKNEYEKNLIDNRTNIWSDNEINKSNFIGFDSSENDSANLCLQTFLETVGLKKSKMETVLDKVNNSIQSEDLKSQKLSESVAENIIIYSDQQESSKSFRKRKMNCNNNTRISQNSSERDSELILANVFISKSSPECTTVKSNDSKRSDVQIINSRTLEKQRQKTRYSNDDLFKPRPLLGGISRRRRGFNCSE